MVRSNAGTGEREVDVVVVLVKVLKVEEEE